MTAGALAEAVGCPHNTLSTHVAILARAGLVIGRREGRTINYRADSAGTRAHRLFSNGLLRRPAGTMWGRFRGRTSIRL
jgi:DNA-binding transcriptional ArsR family regulator